MKAQGAKDGTRWLLLVCLLGAALIAFTVHYARHSNVEEQGSIEFGDVQLRIDADTLNLQTSAKVQLPPSVENGLYSGVPLTFVVQLDVQKPRSLWFPATIYTGQIHYTLTYYELTRHYRVSVVESNVSRNYRSLSSALSGLGELGTLRFSLEDQQQKQLKLSVQNNKELTGSLSMRLSTSTLPLSLQPILRSVWKLASEEYRWSIT